MTDIINLYVEVFLTMIFERISLISYLDIKENKYLQSYISK